MFGPVRLTFLEGDGILVDGFGYPAVMHMITYNFPYYEDLLLNAGLEKELDFYSYHTTREKLQLPEWVHDIAAQVQENSGLRIQRFANLDELLQHLPHLLLALQRSLAQNEDFSSSSQATQALAIEQTLQKGVNPVYIRGIIHNDQVVGAIFAFPNLTETFQALHGEFDQTTILQAIPLAPDGVLNGFGIVPEFEFQGLDALIYIEMEKLAHDLGIDNINIIQISEQTSRMKNDMISLGIEINQTHRRYSKKFSDSEEFDT
ncbi:MAG: hypothetical protein AAF629_34630, partial [Chloroflexota bacterium]